MEFAYRKLFPVNSQMHHYAGSHWKHLESWNQALIFISYLIPHWYPVFKVIVKFKSAHIGYWDKANKINTAQKFRAWIKLPKLTCSINVFCIQGIHNFTNSPELLPMAVQFTGHVIQTETPDNDTALPLVEVLLTLYRLYMYYYQSYLLKMQNKN